MNNKGSLHKPIVNQFWIKVLLFFAIVFLIFSFVAPYLLSNYAIGFIDKGPIGDTIGGLMNPFIAFAGVVVTGLAFYMQYEANKLQSNMFFDGQRDLLFFRLMDDLDQSILLLHTAKNEKEFVGFQALDSLVKSIEDWRMSAFLMKHAKNILVKKPQVVDDGFYMAAEILKYDSFPLLHNPLILKEHFLAAQNDSERRRLLDELIPLIKPSKQSDFENILSALGSRCFYSLGFEHRVFWYREIGDAFLRDLGSPYRRYLAKMSFALNLIFGNENLTYKQYFLNRFTPNEKVLLYFCCSSLSLSSGFKEMLLKVNIFDEYFMQYRFHPSLDRIYNMKEVENMLLKTNYLINGDDSFSDIKIN